MAQKRGRGDDEDELEGGYAGAGVSDEIKEQAARTAVGLQARGWSVSEIVVFLAETSYGPKQRTLERHIAALKRGDTPLSSEKGAGRPQLLDEEQWAVVAGWVLCEERKVDLDRVRRWIKANFDVDMDDSTVSRHKDELGLSFQLLGARPVKAGTTRDEYVLGYFEFVKRLEDEHFFAWDSAKIVCTDSVTNSCRVERTKTLGLKGRKQQKFSSDRPQYTNNYVVGVTRSGHGKLKALMFTHDPAFNPEGGRWMEVKQWCRKFKINPQHIYFTKSSKKYCKEQQAHITQFLHVNRAALRGARILHDAGPAYKKDGHYILEDGANMVVVLPAAQHGELSVLDNKLNAVAKLMWKKERTNTDFAYDALLLLHCINKVRDESISTWWDQNFLLSAQELTLKGVEAQLSSVGGKPPMRQALQEYYIAAYDAWCEENDEKDEGAAKQSAKRGLDGSYWD